MTNQDYYNDGFLAGLLHARDWCKANETYIQDAINEFIEDHPELDEE